MGKLFTIFAAAAFIATMSLGARAQDSSLVVAATTSVEDSGLFDHINPIFTAKTGIAVRVVSRASATALMTAERGTVDVVIVNDPEALDRFVALGEGTRRLRVMSNQFAIVGPQADPANIKGMTDAAAALREIARLRAPFVSRGDNSGTHIAEQRLWQAAGVNPKTRSGTWYRETGLGMGLTVGMAARLGAYTLTDRATWLRAGNAANNPVLLGGDPKLFNAYEVIMVNPEKHPHVNVAAANAFIDWLVSDEGRTAIAGYRVNGEQLFTPAPGPIN
jgi:tungstate transport system substrate-binding protein